MSKRRLEQFEFARPREIVRLHRLNRIYRAAETCLPFLAAAMVAGGWYVGLTRTWVWALELLVSQSGADPARLFMMCAAPPEQTL